MNTAALATDITYANCIVFLHLLAMSIAGHCNKFGVNDVHILFSAVYLM